MQKGPPPILSGCLPAGILKQECQAPHTSDRTGSGGGNVLWIFHPESFKDISQFPNVADLLFTVGNKNDGISLVVRCLRIHLSMQGIQVLSLVWKREGAEGSPFLSQAAG